MAANILKLQDQLKGLPDNALVQYAKNPSGEVPQYLVLGELQRRKTMRDEYQQSQAQKPQSTVAEDLEQGIAQLQSQPAPGQQAQEAPAEEAPQEEQQMAEGGLAALPVPDDMFAEEYANGGIIAFEDGGEVKKFAGPQGSLVTNPYAFNPSAPGVSAATLKYRNALENTELSKGLDYLLAMGMDLATAIGKLGYDYDHYKATGELKRKSETMGFFPRTSAVGDVREKERAAREAGIDQRMAADRAQFQQYLSQAPNINTPRAPGSTASGADYEMIANMVSDIPVTPGVPGVLPNKKLSGPTGANGRADMAGGEAGRDGASAPTRFELPIAPTIPRTEIGIPSSLTIDAYFEQQNKALREAGIDPDYFSKKKTTQEERLKEVSADRDTAKWMALGELGFRLAGSKSPYFGQAAGEAGIGALQTYSGELKDIRKREDAIKDAIEKGEDAQQLLKRGEAKDAMNAIRDREKDILTAKTKQAEIDANRENVTAQLANQIAVTGMNNENSRTIANMQIKGQMQVAQLQKELGLDNSMAQTLVTTATKNFESLLGPEIIKAKIDPTYIISSDVISDAWATAMSQASQIVSKAKRSITGGQETAPSGNLPPLSSFKR